MAVAGSDPSCPSPFDQVGWKGKPSTAEMLCWTAFQGIIFSLMIMLTLGCAHAWVGEGHVSLFLHHQNQGLEDCVGNQPEGAHPAGNVSTLLVCAQALITSLCSVCNCLSQGM